MSTRVTKRTTSEHRNDVETLGPRVRSAAVDDGRERRPLNSARLSDTIPSLRLVVPGAGLAIATFAVVWFGYLATREWQRNAGQLVERRASEALVLLLAALNKDMKGAQVSVLTPINEIALAHDPPHEFREACARAFARFPYPESFFLWTDTGSAEGRTYFFNRADRPPAWDPGTSSLDPYPVVILRDPSAGRDLVRKARLQAAGGRRFAVIEADVAGAHYQTIVHLISGASWRLSGLVGFTVNMDWVRHQYFGDIVRQVAQIGGAEDTMNLVVLDEGRSLVTMNSVGTSAPLLRERRFPLLFLDPDLVPALASRLVTRYWIAGVAPSSGSTLDAVTAGARRTFLLISLPLSPSR